MNSTTIAEANSIPERKFKKNDHVRWIRGFSEKNKTPLFSCGGWINSYRNNISNLVIIRNLFDYNDPHYMTQEIEESELILITK